MQIREISNTAHSAMIATSTLRVSVRPDRDEHGRAYDEVIVQSLSAAEPAAEIQGRQTRIIRVPLPAEDGERV